jgi:hypothetical protein
MKLRAFILTFAILASSFVLMPQAMASQPDTSNKEGVTVAPDTIEDFVGYCRALEVGRYTTAGGNVYTTVFNQCLRQSAGDPNYWGWYVHVYCYRNGAAWDGCRWDSEGHLRYSELGNPFVTYGDAGPWHEPSSGWSAGLVVHGPFSGPWNDAGYDLQSMSNWGHKVRFLLADNTTPLVNLSTVSSAVAYSW